MRRTIGLASLALVALLFTLIGVSRRPSAPDRYASTRFPGARATVPTPRFAEHQEVRFLRAPPALAVESDTAKSPAMHVAERPAAVQLLAEALRAPSFRPYTWRKEVRALSRTLGPEATEELWELCERRDLELEELVAAGALLRERQILDRSRGGTLGTSARSRLRVALAGAHADQVAAGRAAEALGALGTPEDATLLLETWRHGGDPTSRAAADGLKASRSPLVVRSLLEDLIDPTNRTRTHLSTLHGIGREVGWSFDPWLIDEVAERLEGLLVAADGDLGEQARWAPLLTVWSPSTAEELLRRGAEDLPIHVALGLSEGLADDRTVELLADRLVGEPSQLRRPELAERLARCTRALELDASLRASVNETLLRSARTGERSAERRRALLALVQQEDPRVRELAGRIALDDPDSSLRCVSLRVLQGDPESRRLLERVAATDVSSAVRQQAAQTLAAATTDPGETRR